MWRPLLNKLWGTASPSTRSGRAILGVAAALKAAGLRSAEQYMAEFRLGHIEKEHGVPAWMDMSLDGNSCAHHPSFYAAVKRRTFYIPGRAGWGRSTGWPKGSEGLL